MSDESEDIGYEAGGVLSAARAPRVYLRGKASPDIKKIVIGSLEEPDAEEPDAEEPDAEEPDAEEPDDEEEGELISDSLPRDLATLFPALTHLHVWGLVDVKAIPPLPESLKCLDVRGCPDLEEVGSLPTSLEELILERNPRLRALPLGERYPNLWDLSLRACPELPEGIIAKALKAMPALRRLDLSGCTQLTEVRSWPSKLERIDLDRCEQIRLLPAEWPSKLRRLGLRGAKALSSLPSFRERWPDYVDLAGTESLMGMPRPRALRTLYLKGSGVLMPPATEHGATADENVAERTLAYFEDVDICGKGEVKRCKVLVLGNGDAGKTCLSLALEPGQDPHDAENLGSTHGVRFRDDWQLKARVGDTYDRVQLHLWDFGGQEIYHQTHKLFMSKGAVFVVVWKPEQEGRQPEETAEGYQDEWRPLRYWIDFIHMACPWKPRIALVCSHHAEPTEELERRWRAQVEDRYPELERCFYVDSLHRAGELADLEEWLAQNVGDVVNTQGTAVPAYWEVAQELVGSWLAQSDPGRTDESYDTISVESFAKKLGDKLRRVADEDGRGRFRLLSEALANGRFELTPDRVHRTLQFLTSSGWLYWDPELFESQVIIGQKWALNGIYAALDRTPNSAVYKELRRADGQFTLPALKRWVWDETDLTDDQQRLLISFMRQVGICFELVNKEKSWSGQPIYRSFNHLPMAKELDLQPRFDRRSDRHVESVRCDLLHRGHWNELLKDLGETYGTDADYAADGFSLVNGEGQHVCIVVHFDRQDRDGAEPAMRLGLGGTIDVQVAGQEAEERLSDLVRHVRTFLPEGTPDDRSGHEPDRRHRETPPAGTQANRIRLFVSYAWNPSEEQRELIDGSVPSGYEEPVDAIERAFSEPDSRVEVLRDRSVLREGDSIVRFMAQILECHRVLVVHSDKYWRSFFCMFELMRVWNSFVDRKETINDVVLFLELDSSAITDSKARRDYIEHWKGSWEHLPTMLDGCGTSSESFRDGVGTLLRTGMPQICDKWHNRRWSEARAEEIVAWLRGQLEATESPEA